MNKTLLLIMCDFLLLNLLALTRWEKAEPQRALDSAAPKSASAAASPAVNADIIGTWDMLWMPPATTRSMTPDITACAAK